MSVAADIMYFRMREAELRARAEQARRLAEARTTPVRPVRSAPAESQPDPSHRPLLRRWLRA
ncbi:hypothetical protein [Phaeacidiphilus oryzae]|jgi:hypothetical protein|uniref:hypothetical protein n=1 Tax=Phaeacidiphilus oryzae TaxID=348818 RepID=UPI00055CCB37|nr:hypothetical protein [Phaeacidiphilus oryzae]